MPTPDAADVAWDAFMHAFDAPMAIVTVRQGDERSGCLVGFTTQASMQPKRFLVCLSVKNHTFPLAEASDYLAVHQVPAGAKELARLFGGTSGDTVDKFARCGWDDGPYGLPILRECASWFVGRVMERAPWGDHVGFLLDPEVIHPGPTRPLLTTGHAADIEAGHPATP